MQPLAMILRAIQTPAYCIVFLLLLLGAASVSSLGQAVAPEPSGDAMDQAVHALCHEHVALLGEPPIHGLAQTLKFKVELVRRLVDECHYNALFLESGVYDYLHLEQQLRSGNKVTDAMLSAAIGGLWANTEVQALVPFLRQKVNLGTLTLGGLDDAIGAGSYASRAMGPDLVAPLEMQERSRCLTVLERHLQWQYTSDAPYTPADKDKIVGCLNEITTQLASARQPTRSIEENREMVDSLRRNIARNFTEDDFTQKTQELQWINDRERSLYLNYKWLSDRLPPTAGSSSGQRRCTRQRASTVSRGSKAEFLSAPTSRRTRDDTSPRLVSPPSVGTTPSHANRSVI